jgi:predicted negative regulator of RcsB-dependent stress response
VEGAQAQPAGAMVDQISLTALEAVRAEGRNLDQAIEHYHFVIEHAANERDQAFLVPAYLRLADLLEQRARLDEALTLVDQFFSKQADMQPPHAPTDAQRSQMSLRKTRLMAALKQGGHVAG